jgi:hypothetical protein
MVPFVWKPAHSFDAIAVCTMGGMLGTLAAWLQSPMYRFSLPVYFSLKAWSRAR